MKPSMHWDYQTIIEPFRIKVVEPIKFSTRAERMQYLKAAGLNPFLIKSENVIIDLLTDSGTTAQSAAQWAAIQRGDESYAGSPSYDRFETSVRDITGFPEIIPTHQGRAAERILFTTLTQAGQRVISNMLFDTTRANAEAVGCLTMDVPSPELADFSHVAPFKGNIDLNALESALKKHGSNVAMVVLTITNNSGGGQPVSMENIRQTADLCKKYGCLFVMDSCRFAENAWFIKTRESGYAHKTPKEIAREFFSYPDIITVSAKKDGMTNIGGFLAMRNPEWAQLCRNNLILTEGFPTYGGMSGRDLDALAVGIYESLDEDYLRYRIRSTAYVGDGLIKMGVPIIQPAGGHAVYIDAKTFLPHIPVSQYPGQALVAGLYEYGGIRGVELGSVMFGREKPDGAEIPHAFELVRLAIPRRVYTQSHMDYVLEVFEHFKTEAPKLKGVRFTYKPKTLRHFTARFEWIA